MSLPQCPGHKGDAYDAPWFHANGLACADAAESEPEPVAAPATDAGHPNLVLLPRGALPLPGRFLALNVPNTDVASARQLLAAVGRQLAAGQGFGVVLREGWELGYVDVYEAPS